MKRPFFFLIAFAFLNIGGLYSLSQTDECCPFCDPEVLERQSFYQDDLVLALYTHRPIFPGHCLVIPKRHIERFELLSDEESLQMMQVIKKVNQAVLEVFGTSAYLLAQKNGKEVSQSVPHIHFHYIPRKAGDDSGTYFLLNMIWANIGKPISSQKIEEVVSKMKEAIRKQQDANVGQPSFLPNR